MTHFPTALHPTPFAGSATGQDAPPDQRIAGFPTPTQEKTNWCWAAVTSALLSMRTGNAWPQSAVANFWGTSENVTISLGDLLSRLWQGNYLIRYGAEGRAYLQDRANVERDFRSLLDRNIPLPLTISWNGSFENHYVCAFGYGELAGGFAVWIFDPSDADAYQDNKRLLPIEQLYAYRSSAANRTLEGEWSQIFLPYDG